MATLRPVRSRARGRLPFAPTLALGEAGSHTSDGVLQSKPAASSRRSIGLRHHDVNFSVLFSAPHCCHLQLLMVCLFLEVAAPRHGYKLFVPHCNSGYRMFKLSVSFFEAPSDSEGL